MTDWLGKMVSARAVHFASQPALYADETIDLLRASGKVAEELEHLRTQIENLRKAWPHEYRCSSRKCRRCGGRIGDSHCTHGYGCFSPIFGCFSPIVEPEDCGPCDCNRLENLKKALRGEG